MIFMQICYYHRKCNFYQLSSHIASSFVISKECKLEYSLLSGGGGDSAGIQWENGAIRVSYSALVLFP